MKEGWREEPMTAISETGGRHRFLVGPPPEKCHPFRKLLVMQQLPFGWHLELLRA
jgi:hypothetical protein